jgi:hypothetical protein
MADDVGMPPSLFGKSTPAPVRRNVRPAGQVGSLRETLRQKMGIDIPTSMTDAEVTALLGSDVARSQWLAAGPASTATVDRQTLLLRLDVSELPATLTDADVTSLLAMDGPTRNAWFREHFCTVPADGFATEALRQDWANSHRWCPPPALSTVRTPGTTSTPASAPTELPVLLSPLDGSRVLANSNVTFVWKVIDGAAGYELRVCTDAAMTQGCLPGGAGRVGPEVTSVTLTVPAGDYFWSLRAVGADGSFGPSSEVRHLASAAPAATPNAPAEPLPPPVLTSPRDGTQTAPGVPLTFTWAVVPGAASHEVLVCTDPEMTVGCLGGQSRVAAPQSVMTMSLPEGGYYWTVRGIAADGTIGHSAGVRRVFSIPIVGSPTPALPTTSQPGVRTSIQAMTVAPAAPKGISPVVPLLVIAGVAGLGWWFLRDLPSAPPRR